MINLHSAFERALPAAKAGVIAGVVPVVGGRVAAAKAAPRASAACAEPDCDLSYGGGPVEHSPHVYLLLWGPNWNATSPDYQYLTGFYAGLGASPDDTWSTITSQYGDGSGVPAFGTSVFKGAWKDTTAPPNPVTPDDLAAEADGFVSSQHVGDVADAQIVIASQSGTCFSDGFAGSCGQVSITGYCGWHSMTINGVPFTSLPYQLDASTRCGEDFVNSAGTADGHSASATRSAMSLCPPAHLRCRACGATTPVPA